jgi:hypothetical protein
MTILLSRPSSSTNRSEEADLAPGEWIGIAIRSAFVLPRTGAFKDLLDAIDAAAPKQPRA